MIIFSHPNSGKEEVNHLLDIPHNFEIRCDRPPNFHQIAQRIVDRQSGHVICDEEFASMMVSRRVKVLWSRKQRLTLLNVVR